MHRWRSTKGAALVEMVVVTPLLLLMVLGTADFGRVLYTSIVLANAARSGAAYGAQSSIKAADTNGIRTAALAEATDVGAITVSFPSGQSRTCECPGPTVVSCDTTSSCPSSYGVPQVFVTVTTTWSFATLAPWPGIPSTVPLSHTAKVRLQ